MEAKEQTALCITIERPDEQQLQTLDIKSWPVWMKEPSTFDWHYYAAEIYFVVEGEAVLKTADGEATIREGDLVTLPKGLDCAWHVTRTIRMHYRFRS